MDINLNLASSKLQSFVSRWYYYQQVRFPILAHGVLIFVFCFSAVAYALLCDHQLSFIDLRYFIPGFCMAFTTFLLLRILDEFKDAEDDKKYRSHLPVPSGVISLKELKNLGIGIVLFQIALQCFFFPKMLVIYILLMCYLFLMTKEFFIAPWLRKHHFYYVTSHMMIIPLVDLYTSGLFWHLNGVNAPTGLLFFFIVSFCNGIVLEIGRKIRSPHCESVGVETYSSLLGCKKAILLWIFMLFITFCISLAAAWYASLSFSSYAIITGSFIFCLLPSLFFLSSQSSKMSKWIEYASGLWTLTMYLSLGGLPMLKNLFQLQIFQL